MYTSLWTLTLLIRGYFSENKSIFFHSAKPHIFVKWVNSSLGCLFFPTFYLGRGGWLLTELVSMDLLNNMCLCSLCMFGTFPEWNLSCSSQLSSEGGDLNADCFLLLLCKPLVRKGQYPSFRAVVKDGLTADHHACMSLSKLAAWIIH